MSTLTGTLVLNGVSGEGVLRLTPPNPNQLINSAGGPGSISPATIEIAVSGGELVDPPDVPGNDILLPLASVYQVEYRSDTGDELVGEWAIVGSPFDIGTQALAFPDGHPLTTKGPANYNSFFDPTLPGIVFQATLPNGSIGTGQIPFGAAVSLNSGQLTDFKITQVNDTTITIAPGFIFGTQQNDLDTLTVLAGAGTGDLQIWASQDGGVFVTDLGDTLNQESFDFNRISFASIDDFNNSGIGASSIGSLSIIDDVIDGTNSDPIISAAGYPIVEAGDNIVLTPDGPGAVIISATGGGGGGINSAQISDFLMSKVEDVNTVNIKPGYITVSSGVVFFDLSSISLADGAADDEITVYAHSDGTLHCFPDIPDNAEFISVTGGITIDPDGTAWTTNAVGAVGTIPISGGNFAGPVDSRSISGLAALNILSVGAGLTLNPNPGPGNKLLALALTPDVLPTFAHGALLQANGSNGEIETSNIQLQYTTLISDSLTLAPGATQQIEFDGTSITLFGLLFGTLQDYGGAGIPLLVSVSTIGGGVVLVTIVNVGLVPMDSPITVNILCVFQGGA